MKATEPPFPVALFNVVRYSGGFRERGRGAYVYTTLRPKGPKKCFLRPPPAPYWKNWIRHYAVLLSL